MFQFNFNDFILFIYNLFFPAVRILALFSTAPLFNSKFIEKKIKLIMAFVISWIFSSFLPKVNIAIFSVDGILIIIEQMLIGILLGLTMQLIFSSIFMSGEIISLQMGLSFSSLFDFNSRSNLSALSHFVHIFLLLLFLEWNGHIWMLSALFDTFITIPIQKIYLDPNIFLKVVNFSKYIFFDSIMLLFPIIIVQLLLNLSIGILNRVAPQISILSLGFTVTLLVGIILLYFFIPIFPSSCIVIFRRLQSFVLTLFNS
ncbi:flagellar biosynthetic protein FliR [Buchnera aphidicola str. Bp (Baizongia pistaciae)]|uniref:Flagellar biosynthetic protein FliR n=1 Tax=Buchnera aphidicola subsp. Baizongia pistaciae (strain Bp) TaxID=224915 RepID=FLIR_BUCBP|nr:flagellar biosynthetic protein FliR [Buchnera aphidicola]Q89AZ0.1 RecName: Full=Flagellar biosynthetic protein FliR [Buchnera aphidicola str. Bp (Baizongia pistaciae)]AAO26814.1 flagellar biosynthetic protein FliR [Buchnera aphidicola str. Bp (Baizongia pistaciae)]